MKNYKIEVAKPYQDIKTPFSIDEKGALAEYVINDPERMPQLALGATIIIRDFRKEDPNADYEEFWYSGRVVGLKAVSPFNPERTSMLYQQDESFDPSKPLENIRGPHTHQPMVVQVALTQEWTLKKGGRYDSAAIQRPPSASSRMFFPNLEPHPLDNSPSLRIVLGIRQNGLSLGMIGFGNKPYGWRTQEFIPYKWDIEALDNKHMFIVGESGSGKTVLLKNLAYEIKKHNSSNRIILTDVQGDISQLLFWDFVKRVSADDWRPLVTDVDYLAARNVFGKFRLIVPKTKDGSAENNITALMKVALARGVDARRASLRFQDLDSPKEAEFLFRTSSEHVPQLLQDLAEGITANLEDASLSRLQTAVSRLLTRNSSNQINLPTNGVPYYRSTFEAAKRVLHDLEDYFDRDLGALQGDANPLDDFNFDGTTILYLAHLNQDERFMWEMQLVKWLYRNKVSMHDTFVFFDEAHQIIPKAKSEGYGISAEVLTRLRSNFERLSREGRKFRLNLILSTQSPQDLHPIVQEQCPTRIVMKINRKSAALADLDSELALVASSFNQGQFWIQSPFNGTPDWIRVHSIAPPVPHDSMDNFWRALEREAF